VLDVAVDLTANLFATSRQRAAAAWLTVTWAVVNPADLPFGADRFDRVLSAVRRRADLTRLALAAGLV